MKQMNKLIAALGRKTAQKAVDVVSWPYCYEAKLSKDARKKLLKKQRRVEKEKMSESKLRSLGEKAIVKIGRTMVKIDVTTTCPWINYQPEEPEAVKRMRECKNVKE